MLDRLGCYLRARLKKAQILFRETLLVRTVPAGYADAESFPCPRFRPGAGRGLKRRLSAPSTVAWLRRAG